MTQKAYQSWHTNLKSKVDELSKLGMEYITNKELRLGTEDQKQKFDGLTERIEGNLEGLSTMYGTNLKPPELRDIQDTYAAFSGNLTHPTRLSHFINSLQKLPNMLVEIDEKVSFDEIFEKYKADGTLEKLVEELLQLLERILDEGQDELSVSTYRDLEQIIEGLKKRKDQSIHEINVWVDWGVKVCLGIADTMVGAPVLTPVYEAIKIGKDTKKRMMECHEEAQLEFARKREMKMAEKVLIDEPKDISDEDLTLKIEPPKE
jgi:hypothetical protein